ncbi:CRISPR-associated protein Cse2 [Thiohalocapsa halophila]|uniref:CRISPR-associated protein Cse2 n=1 Tax=Thiohalocapsa halophila TaxID=69359 RepID=A0ABS1CM17_9GAMM|nr:type I-E CRISPR-associated protein Cse2/CasB [Thiohalocapsa halophila]MBK1632956.1 CRISPR-associated protein Cse2 [Thiohalocapsa halophila]
MTATETAPSPEQAKPERDRIGRLAHIIAQAARFEGDPVGLGEGERAAIARLDPDAELRPQQVAALTRALVQADLEPEHWRPETWRRWALIAHGMALAGHDPKQRLGKQLFRAAVNESRVTKLLTARGDAFRQLLPRVLRLMASHEDGIKPNWDELGRLILAQDRKDSTSQVKAEELRLRIASAYYSAERQDARQSDATPSTESR